jgi:soluble lytic murein transglycosylase-like protein
MADAVLRWVGEAKLAEKATGIPADVLLGLVSVESAGIEGRTSSANAGGLTQFIPGTAARYHVNVTPGHAHSQIMGAARYLVDLGYHNNPTRALNAYNGAQTIGGRPNPYASNVLRAARRYRGASGTSSTGPATVPTAGGDPATTTTTAGGELIGADKRSGLLKALTWVALVTGGLALTGIGITRSTGAAA